MYCSSFTRSGTGRFGLVFFDLLAVFEGKAGGQHPAGSKDLHITNGFQTDRLQNEDMS